MSNAIVPIRVANDIEKLRTWEGISSPFDLATYMAKVLSVDLNALVGLTEVIYSNVEPQGLERKKLWVKTDEPVALCIPTGDEYTFIYRYPPDTPIIWTKGKSNIPPYMRRLVESEISDMGLTAIDSDKPYAWVIFNP